MITLNIKAQNPIELSPDRPKVGEKVTIRYYPSAEKAKIDNPNNLQLIFGISPLPVQSDTVRMQRKNDFWEATLRIGEEAKLSTFYFRDNEQVDKGVNNRLYHMRIYEAIIKEEVYKKAPSLEGLTDLKGNKVDITKFKDKVVVIDFWATWCSPCLAAFPHLQNVYEDYKNNPDIKFIVLNSALGDSLEDARTWANKNNYTFPIYFAKNKKVTDAFNVRSMPQTLIIDENGIIKLRKVVFEKAVFKQKMAVVINMLLD